MLLGLGRLNINYMIMLRTMTFYRHLLHSCGVFLRDVFLMFFLDNFNNNCVLRTLYLSKNDAIKSVRQAFRPLKTM